MHYKPGPKLQKFGDLFRAAPCPFCMAQIACKSDLKSENLILKKECPDPCRDGALEV